MNQQQLAANAGRTNQVIISDEFFIYSTGRPAAALAPAATSTTNISILNDSDFLVEKLSFNADIAGATQTASGLLLPNVSVLLTNTSNGKQLTNVQVPLTGFFGTGQLPFILPRQYLIPASSTLQIQLISFEAAISPFITLNFIGRKIYWGPAGG
jgi:hypothetical protein